MQERSIDRECERYGYAGTGPTHRFAINGSLPQEPEPRSPPAEPAGRGRHLREHHVIHGFGKAMHLGMNPSHRQKALDPYPVTPDKMPLECRSDPLIANANVMDMQVPDRRTASRSMDRSHKNQSPARRPQSRLAGHHRPRLAACIYILQTACSAPPARQQPVPLPCPKMSLRCPARRC